MCARLHRSLPVHRRRRLLDFRQSPSHRWKGSAGRYTFQMNARLRIACLLFLLLFQTMATASVVPFGIEWDREHERLHSQGWGHHHDEDGSRHADACDGPLQHTHSDHGLGLTFLVDAPRADVPLQRVRLRIDAPALHAAEPYIAVLLRPPRPSLT